MVIVRNTIQGGSYITLTVSQSDNVNGNMVPLNVLINVTGNCQLFTVMGFASFSKSTHISREHKLEILKESPKQAQKPLLFLDVRVDQDNVSEFIKDSAIMHSYEYKSTNGSRMKIYLINTLGIWLKAN